MRMRCLLIVAGSVAWLFAAAVLAKGPASEESSLTVEDAERAQSGTPAERNRTNAVESVREDNRRKVAQLAEENRKLRQKVLELEGKIAKMPHSFAEQKSNGCDRAARTLRTGLEVEEQYPYSDAVYAPQTVAVLDANRQLGMVALGAGRRDGMRPGLEYRVVREGWVIARLRTEIVRKFIAGAKVLPRGRTDFPVTGDKAVLGTERKKRD